jgi:cell division protein ZapA
MGMQAFMAKQPVRVQIFNQSYSLLAEGDPREVQKIAHQIDDLMTTISERTASSDSTRVAVLACMHLADQLRAAEEKIQSFEAESARMSTMLEEALEQA